jgi:transcription elongation factor GreA
VEESYRQQTFLTPQGYQKLEQELVHLRTTRRQQVARRLHEALEEGSILENAELEDARNEQAFVEGRILDLETILGSAIIIDEKGPSETVGLGSRVTIVEGSEAPETYHIVGSVEADPIKGLISNESPLGRALMGRKVGDKADVNAPAGVLVFEIVSIQ